MFIPIFMKGASPGEGLNSFPSFFPSLTIVFILILGTGIFLSESVAQKAEKDGLSRFDRLAEEATLLNKRGKFEEVISLLEPHKSDKKNDSALFFNELGIAYRNKNRLIEAMEAYRQALSRDPENPVVMKNLGDAHYLQKEYSRAIDLYEKALLNNPRFQQARYSLGLAYYRLEKYKEALEEFEIFLQSNPKDEDALKFREAILKKMKGLKK